MVEVRSNTQRADDGTWMSYQSDPERFEVLAPSVIPTPIYRVSEYTYDVDFLTNHNSADLEGQVAFLTSTNDNLFFQMSKSPVAVYCVQRLPAPNAPSDNDGFADYVSCNGPEANPRNQPADPICICNVFPDRMIGLENATEMNAACGKVQWASDGTHDSPPCNCTGADGVRSKWSTPNASDYYVGAMPTWLPYFYFQTPAETYPGAVRFGINYATPKKGECSQDAPVGQGGCTWRRDAAATVIWGNDLLNRGWNRTAVNHWPLRMHGPNTTQQILSNLPVFKAALKGVTSLMTHRCCGC
eukprot:m.66612 g.66612  ORF g.66612 m.66612 type:complete len:300 (+) comp8371_c0_seq2:191-1090(+)